MRKDALTNHANDPADQDSGAHHERMLSGAFTLAALNAQRPRKATGCFANDGNSFAGDLGRVYRNVEARGVLIGIGI